MPRTMARNVLAVCRRNHLLFSGSPLSCDAGHDHMLFRCRLRHGSGPCADSFIRPPFGAGCVKPEEAEDDDV